MYRLPVLRVGFCECNPYLVQYCKELTGYALNPSRFIGKQLSEVDLIPEGIEVREDSRSLILRGILIPEDNHERALSRSLCHFFVDIHQSSNFNPPWYIGITRYDIVPNELYRASPYQGVVTLTWSFARVPSLDDILCAIIYLIQKMAQQECEEWFSRMGRWKGTFLKRVYLLKRTLWEVGII